MGTSAVRSFSDPDDFYGSVRAGDVAGLVLGRGEFRAEITRIDLGSIWMQRFRESAPRTLRSAAHSSRSVILFRTPEGDAAFRHRGIDFDDDMIMFLGAGAVDHQISAGPIGLGTMSLSPGDLARFGPLLAERDLAAPRTTTTLRPQPGIRAPALPARGRRATCLDGSREVGAPKSRQGARGFVDRRDGRLPGARRAWSKLACRGAARDAGQADGRASRGARRFSHLHHRPLPGVGRDGTVIGARLS